MSYKVIKVKGEASQHKYSEAFRRSVVAEYERGILNKDQLNTYANASAERVKT